MSFDYIATIIGYLATVFLATSLLMKSVLKLRIFNLFGSLAFTVYGLMLQAWPVAIPNAALAMINLYFIAKACTRSGSRLEMLRCSRNDILFGKFIEYHAYDIRKFMPNFNWKNTPDDAVCFFLMRDMELAGVWIATIRDSYTYEVLLDYVIDKFRDFKGGKFIYDENRNLLQNIGIRFLISDRHTDAHSKYLVKVGFEYREKDHVYKYKI